MVSIPAVIALIFCVYVRPQEFIPELAQIPLLNLLCLAALLGLVIDLRLGFARLRAAPQLIAVSALVGWIILGAARALPAAEFTAHLLIIVVSFVFYVVIAHSAQSFRALRTIGAAVVVVTVILAAVGVDQGTSATGCVLLDESMRSGRFDGRFCDSVEQCWRGNAKPGGKYACEHIGAFGTTSVDRRVRYRGVLQDPNELALVLSCGLPLLFAVLARRRTMLRFLVVAGVFGLVATGVILTRSRSGQLVILAVLGTYFVRRFGVRSVIGLALLGLPIAMLGGRQGEAADMSSEHRLEAWRTALELAKAEPVFGVGQGMFVEYHFLTAHNSYLLALAELGIVGMFVWSLVLYMSVRIPWTVLRSLDDVPEAEVARSWATAILAAMVGLLAGMMFLSLAYHVVVWIFMGLSGALALAVQRHLPDWTPDFSWRDLVVVAALDAAFIAVLAVFLRMRGF